MASNARLARSLRLILDSVLGCRHGTTAQAAYHFNYDDTLRIARVSSWFGRVWNDCDAHSYNGCAD